jgi:hypothetical protein
VKYLFKINSGFDGFTPSQIPTRQRDGQLTLGWPRYIEALEPGDEVWVYFLGRHRFTPGVYAIGASWASTLRGYG